MLSKTNIVIVKPEDSQRWWSLFTKHYSTH